MRKVLALLFIIAILILFTWFVNPKFFTAFNLTNLARNSALLSIYAIGVGFVIIGGGIDLSIGSIVALTGYVTAWTLAGPPIGPGWPPVAVLPLVLGIGLGIGLVQGSLVAHGRLQPFVVTLCGLLIYRGIARIISSDKSASLGQEQKFVRFLTEGSVPLGLSVPFIVCLLVLIAVAAHLFLAHTIWGRYIYAVGNNEEASLFSGINVPFTKIITFVICSVLAALSGVLEVSNVKAITPSGTGGFYELYAIAAAVLGGCSLRGGEGNVLGIILGAIAIKLTTNAMNILGIRSQWEYFVLGMVILIGALIDSGFEHFRGRQQERRGAAQA